MTNFSQLFPYKRPAVIGMIHVLALPGTPAYDGDDDRIIAQAVEEAIIYKEAGLDAFAIENMHDIPYLNKDVGPEVTAFMTRVAIEVKKATDHMIGGVQVLAAANKQALAIAKAAKLEFIRAEGFVFAHVADEGIIQSDAGELLRYRKAIGAEDILVFTDMKKKHSAHAITADVDLGETIHAAEFFKSDGVIITGTSTGATVDSKELMQVKPQTKLPLLLGSGITIDNVVNYAPYCDGVIVGSHFKKKGYWKNEVDKDRVVAFMDKFKDQILS